MEALLQAKNNEKFEIIQFLRAGAALLVVMAHLMLRLMRFKLFPDEYAVTAFHLGNGGVYIFFVISGFIMAYTSAGDAGLTGSKQFILRRIWRIVPLYWLATAIYAIRLSIGRPTPGLDELLKSFLFIPYMDSLSVYRPVLGVGWTLDFEMYFYAVLAVGLLFEGRIRAIAIFSFFFALIGIGYLAGWSRGNVLLKFCSDPIIAYFMLGMLVCYVREYLRRLFVNFGVWLVSLAATLLLWFALINSSMNDATYAIAATLPAAMLVALAVTCPRVFDGPMSRAMILLGDSSYSLYLFHSFVVGPITIAFLRLQLGMQFSLAYLSVGVMACVVTGIAVHLCVEKNMLAALRPFFLGKPSRSAVKLVSEQKS